MALYYSRSQIERPQLEAFAKSAQVHNRTASAKHHIFLSHSHHDGDLVLSAAAWLGEYSSQIYVDWKDSSMPSVTSPETARLIKRKISETKKFILLATNNALESRWVPWELGIADKTNGQDHVAILPVTEYPHNWRGSEYVGIYCWIGPGENKTTGQSGPAVYEPGRDEGIWLKEWLEK
jgi:hypothetical protein